MRLEAADPTLRDVLPLTPLAQGLLFHALYDGPQADAYRRQVSLGLSGAIDLDRFRDAVTRLLTRHPQLRAYFAWLGLAEPVQVIGDLPMAFETVDLTGHHESERAERLDRLTAQERERSFDLDHPPLIRFLLVRVGADRHRLVITYHQLLLDGWSLPVIIRELLTAYAGTAMPPAPDYRTYLDWLSRQDRAAAAAAWRAAYDGVDGATLVADAIAEAARLGHEDLPRRLDVTLPPDLTDALRAAGRGRDLTLASLVQGAWGIVVGGLTGRRDVVFGTVVAGAG